MHEKNIALPLLSDTPILEANRRDQLHFRETAEVLGEAAVETRDPITIGVFGKWGSGKTSMMRLMKEVVEKQSSAALGIVIQIPVVPPIAAGFTPAP